MNSAKLNLPDHFAVIVPDDALAPVTMSGLEAVFSTQAKPRHGQGILVRDRAGRVYIRRYVNRSRGQWAAQARNPAFRSLHHRRDGLRVLAVCVARGLRPIDTSQPDWQDRRRLSMFPLLTLSQVEGLGAD